jgi:spore maturation protein CgeB
MPDPDWARVVVYPANSPDDALQALAQAGKADIIIKASGIGVFDDLLEAAVPDAAKPGQRCIFWDVDAPATLDRIAENPQDPFRTQIPKYDFIFTYGGGEPVVRAYAELGASCCVPVYNGLDPSTHFPVLPDASYACMLSFLGNRLPDRELRVEKFFLAPAGRMNGFRFLLGGAGWDDKPKPENVRYIGHVYTRDHNAVNCSSRAVLNISRESMARYGYSPATRVFEAAGAAACIVTDKWEGIENFFDPGEEILVAESGDEVAELLAGLSVEKSARIGQAAQRRVLAEHTYAHRARQVDGLLNA